jgi:YHS domain-containing protein
MSLLVSLVSLVTLAGGHSSDSMHCVLTGDAYAKAAETIDYKGVRYGTCCGGCGGDFIAKPDAILAEDVKKNILVGLSLFDPVSGERIEAKPDSPSSIYKSVKYYFAKADEKATFDATPAKFTAAPTKEVLHCPVQNDAIANYAAAGGYVDVDGVRYYVCCASCLAMLQKDPSQYTGKVASMIQTAKPEPLKAK